jgi:valyl-tRNA synthetase
MMQPRGDRTNVVLEPMLTDQWFVAMTKPAPAGTLHPGQSITEVALDVVRKGEVQFFPSNWTTTYNQWLENIQDWCISRQLWWGHQIPAWYGENGQVFVAHTAEQAQEKAQAIGYHGTLTRDPDVLDTWFSSALVPFTTFGWPEQTADLKKYLPSSVLVTGFDIIFFWVARMVMMTTHLTGEVPFKHVYVHGLIRDAEGQKMSKSKGNTLDPVDLIDGIDLESLVTKRLFGLMNPKQAAQIEKDTRKHFPDGIPSFGTDALRFTMAAYASLGRNINFDLKRCEGYRNFCSKLWNASRFVLMHTEQVNIEQPQDAQTQKLFQSITPLTQAKLSALTQPLGLPERWVLSRLQHVKAEVEKGFAEYRFDNIAHSLYHFIWDEYCDWYLELAKVQIQSGDSFTQATCRATLMTVLEEILRLMHPITPFITEALWQKISVIAGTRLIDSVSSVSVQPYPAADVAFIDSQAEDQFAELKAQIEAVRALRSEMSIPPGERLPLIAQGNAKSLAQHTPYLSAMARLSSVEITDTIPTDTDAPVQVVGQTRLMLKVEIDLAAERIRLDKEITRLMQEIEKVNGQLSNEAFVSRAPEAVVTQAKARRSQFAETLEKVSAQRLRLGD